MPAKKKVDLDKLAANLRALVEQVEIGDPDKVNRTLLTSVSGSLRQMSDDTYEKSNQMNNIAMAMDDAASALDELGIALADANPPARRRTR